MENIAVRREGQKLILEIDLSVAVGDSQTGRSTIVATTRGNRQLVLRGEDGAEEVLFLNVNLFKPKARQQRNVVLID